MEEIGTFIPSISGIWDKDPVSDIDTMKIYLDLHEKDIQELIKDIMEKENHLDTLKMILKQRYFLEDPYYTEATREKERMNIVKFLSKKYGK